MLDGKPFIKSYDTRIIIHKTNGQDKYRLIGNMPQPLLHNQHLKTSSLS